MRSATEWLEAIAEAVKADTAGSPEKLDSIINEICILQIKKIDQQILLREAQAENQKLLTLAASRAGDYAELLKENARLKAERARN